jgi:hypothetical protein
MRRSESNERRPNDRVLQTRQLSSPTYEEPSSTPHGASARTYGPKGQYSSEIQQRPHCSARSASSKRVRASVNKATNGCCAEFGDDRPSDQVNVHEVNDQH